jgi:hypothetical protein
VPLVHSVDAAPEPGYVPSKKLAEFVRCPDLTCRWHGCDRPTFDCDIDHAVPHADGGPTRASNLKCYCRTQHRLKRLQAGPILDAPPGAGYPRNIRWCIVRRCRRLNLTGRFLLSATSDPAEQMA